LGTSGKKGFARPTRAGRHRDIKSTEIVRETDFVREYC
jgi:hypothetical protein